MPKNFVVESLRHHLLRGLERVRSDCPPEDQAAWEQVTDTLSIGKKTGEGLSVTWKLPIPGTLPLSRKAFMLYRRGDLAKEPPSQDPFHTNVEAADRVVSEIGSLLGLATIPYRDARIDREEDFHDEWAESVKSEQVMVHKAFEVCTAPENCFILGLMGDLRGKRILDLGCGLGEGAVYFALQGADVTACDLSAQMLELTRAVAALHGTEIEIHQSSAEDTGLPGGYFDIVYAGNLLHHVDLSRTLDEIRRVLVPGGRFYTWDPLAHNFAINFYRRMAKSVRTADEHPLRMSDFSLFEECFKDVDCRFFWLLTLAVFFRFYFWERVHPSRERYWKKILTEADRLSAFYGFFEKWDKRILRAFPWLGRYCWNIVVWGRKK